MNFVLQEGLYNFNLHLMMLNFNSSVSVTVWDDQNVPNVKITIPWFIEPQSTNDLWMCIYVCVCVCVYEWESLSHVQLSATVACQAPLSMKFSSREYWRFPSPGDLPDSGIESGSLALQADSLISEPEKTHTHTYTHISYLRI